MYLLYIKRQEEKTEQSAPACLHVRFCCICPGTSTGTQMKAIHSTNSTVSCYCWRKVHLRVYQRLEGVAAQ